MPSRVHISRKRRSFVAPQRRAPQRFSSHDLCVRRILRVGTVGFPTNGRILKHLLCIPFPRSNKICYYDVVPKKLPLHAEEAPRHMRHHMRHHSHRNPHANSRSASSHHVHHRRLVWGRKERCWYRLHSSKLYTLELRRAATGDVPVCVFDLNNGATVAKRPGKVGRTTPLLLRLSWRRPSRICSLSVGSGRCLSCLCCRRRYRLRRSRFCAAGTSCAVLVAAAVAAAVTASAAAAFAVLLKACAGRHRHRRWTFYLRCLRRCGFDLP